MSRIRMTKDARKDSVLNAALIVAEKKGFAKMLQKDIAKAADCGFGTVTLYFGNMTKLRGAVMRAAVKQERLPIIAAGLALGDKDAKKARPDLKAKALATLG